ncbi:HMG (high mobility group) box [Seminavis robusta]|uniref:HMG (High mobility group) box n=1 Tax=Seminavis robusta TaxID=568900 RepID=A0A9N8EM32_9STRA|nr:HMG (high mobility group) box [Seminavis robusta]|eukprot:Sro1203_g252110.1 HMG (high mobility group) box (365) ;mRNA; f:23301-24530
MAKKASPKKGKGKKDSASPLKERNAEKVNNDENKEDNSLRADDENKTNDEVPAKTGSEKKSSPEEKKKDTDESKEEKKAEEDKNHSKKRKADDTVDDKADNTDITGGDNQKADATHNDDTADAMTTENDDEEDAKPAAKPTAETPAIDLTRPIKKARSAYFIFGDERRPEIQAKHKGEGVAVVARELGAQWNALSEEEKAPYQEKAALEREEVAKRLEQLKEAGIDLSTLPGAATANESDNALVFPLARMRKICKLDPEVKGMSKEALLLITKCAELVTAKLGIETVKIAQIQNRRKLLPDDVAEVCQSRDPFLFLRDDVRDLVREQVVQKQKEKENNGKTAKEAKAAANSKPLTAYFAAKSSS